MMIEEAYRKKFARSLVCSTEAQQRFPSGVTHDARFASPFPLYVERAEGAYKWDLDGNRLIDYWCGHGSLLLGHSHPVVTAAVQAQAARGTHFGAGHCAELRWAELVQRLVPGAERVRFTASGTEATMLALRLARAYTCRPTIVRFAGHFHGWHDLIAPGADPDDPHCGIDAELLARLLILPPELEVVEATLRERTDIAAVIVEPSGASYGTLPLADDFVRGLRALTAAHDVLLICDEVVTGFRVSPGGMQARAGIVADLTCLAKILAGGLPGGAVAGREDILRLLAFGDAEWNKTHKLRHQGTFNANPLSAAAGVAALNIVAQGEVGATAAARCQELIEAFNEVLRAHSLRGWTVYGDSSIFHLFVDPTLDIAPGELPTAAPFAARKRGGAPHMLRLLRMALPLAGIDLMRGTSGFVSAVHSREDIAASAAALEQAITMVRDEW